MIQGAIQSVGEIDVGEGRDERDGGIYYLAAVKGDFPLPDWEWVWGNKPGWDGEEGYTEDTTCQAVREVRERRLPLPLLRNAAHQSRMLKR